jgi:murein DD-endopeptidase MepM/ murein hydrolase activator NlpD
VGNRAALGELKAGAKTMGKRISDRIVTCAAAAALLALAGCVGSQDASEAPVEVKGTPTDGTLVAAAPQAKTQTAPRIDRQGVISYDGYQAAVARDGDTVASVADRIGLSATELGAYNGLQADHPLREGDELVLPARPGGYGAAPAPQPVYGAPAATQVPSFQDPTATQGGWSNSIEAAPLDGGATGLAPAAPAPAATASAHGWSPDLAAAAIDRSTATVPQGTLPPPPSASQPLPPDPVRPSGLSSPQLNQYQTPPAQQAPAPAPQAPAPRPVEVIGSGADQIGEPATVAAAPQPQQPAVTPVVTPAPAPQVLQAPAPAAPAGKLRLIPPVQGTVVTGFSQSGRSGSDGISFAAPASSPVVASADGEVALVSKSLGGLGNIVLIRHQDDFLTVYGRIEQVQVGKGDLVRQGQRIGSVGSTSRPRVHFELRRGAESLDPALYF